MNQVEEESEQVIEIRYDIDIKIELSDVRFMKSLFAGLISLQRYHTLSVSFITDISGLT